MVPPVFALHVHLNAPGRRDDIQTGCIITTQFYWQQHRARGRHSKEVKVFHHLLAAVRRMEPSGDEGRDVGCDTDDLCRQPGPVSANDGQEVNANGAADPRGPDIIYYLLCIIQIAIHPQLVILLASGLSHSLSYQLTQFNANGSTQERCLHIN